MTVSVAFIAAWLGAHAYGLPQQRAVIDHAWAESRLRPGAISRHHDYGLFQWRGGRRRALFRFAVWRGRPWTDSETQLEFLDVELRAMPFASRFFAARSATSAYALFCRHYERRAVC